QKAVQLLTVWFIDQETKMNPHLEYGQAIPGRVEGRGIGIIETGSFLMVINALEFLKASKAIDQLDMPALKKWFADYNDWLLTSQKGWDERMWHNNHGSSYDSQVATFGLFVGNDSVAQMILDSVKIKRIDRQIEPDGSQPWELERTKSMNYSLKNLIHLMENAILAEQLGIDLWNYESADGGSISQGVRFLIPYMTEGKEWQYVQYGGLESQMERFIEVVWIASLYLDDELIDSAADQLVSGQTPAPSFLLLYPKLND
ncbi:MAG: alginate lyase family protein, partial [Bacteroidota bacterium]